LAVGEMPAPLAAFSPDGRSLAVAPGRHARGPALALWELSTGQVRWQPEGPGSPVTALAFSADGKVLVTGHADTTVLLWDVAGRARVGPAPAAADLDRRWADLDSGDARVAFGAVRALAAAPAQAVALVRKRVRPAAGRALAPAEVARLIAELDSEEFQTRERAFAGLARQGGAVEAELRKALAAKPALEPRRRLEQLLRRLHARAVPAEMVRPLRAVEVLEWAGTAQARQALAALAGGWQGSPLTHAAAEALGRLTGPGRR
jgi:hypothetical protein